MPSFLLQRTHPPEPSVVLFVMPFGVKGGTDYDQLYERGLKPTVERMGLKPERVDSLYGPVGMVELIWRAIQRAEIVVVDFSAQSVNVGIELGWAMGIGKRAIFITQDEKNIPTDLRGMNRYLLYSESFFDMQKLDSELTQQLEALREEPAEEMAAVPYDGYNVIKAPAYVQAVEKDYATVRTDDGTYAVITGADIDYARFFSDLTRRLRPGDRLDGAFVVDVATKKPRYTLLRSEDNPWPSIAARYPLGTAFSSVVVNTDENAGAWVRLLGRINGLVPRSAFPGALPAVGSKLQVVVTKLDVNARKVSLQLAQPNPAKAATPVVLPDVGDELDGAVSRIVPKADGRGGYLLVDLPGYQRPAMLLMKDMTDILRPDFEDGRIKIDDIIPVRVVNVDPDRKKVLIADREDTDHTNEDIARSEPSVNGATV